MTVKDLKNYIRDLPETLEIECNTIQTGTSSLWAYPIDYTVDNRAFILICQ